MNINQYLQSNFSQIKKKIIAVTRNHQNTDDLISDIILDLLEKNNDFINKLLQDGKVQHYLVKAAYIQYNSSTSPFYLKYKKHQPVEIEQDIQLYDEVEIHEDTEKMAKDVKLYIGNLPFYERTLAEKHFVDGNSLRQMSSLYNINREYITRDVKNIKNNIRISFNKKDYRTK